MHKGKIVMEETYIETDVKKIKDYFIQNSNEWIECIEELDDYIGILGEYRYHPMNDLNYIPTLEALEKAFYGYDEDTGEEFCLNKKYYRMDCDRLVSSDFINYDDFITKETIMLLSKYREQVPEIDDNKELKSLFDKIKEDKK